MSRLTYYDSFNEPCFKINDTVYKNDISFRLAAYENTGLSPKEVTELRDKQTPQKPYNHCTAHKGFCPRCLSLEDTDSNFCRICGQALRWTEETSLTQPFKSNRV